VSMPSRSGSTPDPRAWFAAQQRRMEAELDEGRTVHGHPVARGNSAEEQWRRMLTNHLPARYQASAAWVVDADGGCSEQIDIVIHDRQFSPCLLDIAGGRYIPAESVYAVLEVKQSINKEHLRYAGAKIASVRRLRRTSGDYRHHQGTGRTDIKPILGGIVTFGSDWSPAFGSPFREAVAAAVPDERIDIGCALRAGGFDLLYPQGSSPELTRSAADSSLIFFFLRLLHRLKGIGTVPAIDYEQYSRTLVTPAD
jgi:hypothetical protein